MGVEIKFLGGVRQIGGNMLIFITSGIGYIFDFGVNMALLKRKERLGIRKIREKLREHGLIPDIEMLEEEHHIKIKAIFISHGHMDHWQGIKGLPPRRRGIPIYCSPFTCEWVKRQMGKEAHEFNFKKLNLTLDPVGEKRFYDDEKIRVVPFIVDHSIPDACSFLIIDKVHNKRIIYTGDFRDHGPLSQQVLEPRQSQFWTYFKNYLKSSSVDAFICDATNYSDIIKYNTEEDVEYDVRRLINAFGESLIFVVISTLSDIYRIHTICKVCQKTHRNIRIDGEYGQVVNILKDSSTYSIASGIVSPLLNLKVIDSHERQEIERNPQKFLIISTPHRIFRLISGVSRDIIEGSCCIISTSEHFVEELGISTKDFKDEISSYGVQVYESHASGHVYPDRMMSIIEALQPSTVYPIHTNYPEGVAKFIRGHRVPTEVCIPQLNERYVV